MAKIKLTLDKREDHKHADGTYPLVLRISHQSKTRDISMNRYLHEDQFDSANKEISGITNAVRYTKKLQKIFSDIDLWLDENKADIKLWSIVKLKDKIERQFFKKQSELSVLEHAGKFFLRKRAIGKYSTISSYESALKVMVKFNMRQAGQDDSIKIKTLYKFHGHISFDVLEFFKSYDMPIKAFNLEYAKDLRAYMAGLGNSKNTVNIHLRSIQSILNDAEETYDELKGHRPLDRLKITSTENEPVVLSMYEINLLRSCAFKENSSFFHVRNYFLFMFNNMGMNFYDIALAKVHQFDGERFSYTRKKTEEQGDYFSIIQNSENLKIIEYYAKGKKPDDYLFPLIPADTPDDLIFRVKDNKANWFRKNMKKMAPIAGIDKKITTYTARDTWTNIGLNMGIDIRKISSGLGHSSVQITEKHYSQTIQAKLLDEINKQITAIQ